MSRIRLACFTVCVWIAMFVAMPKISECAEEQGTARADNGFAPVETIAEPRLDGKVLTVAAYGAIFGLLALYAFSLFKRGKDVARAAADLERRLDSSG